VSKEASDSAGQTAVVLMDFMASGACAPGFKDVGSLAFQDHQCIRGLELWGWAYHVEMRGMESKSFGDMSNGHWGSCELLTERRRLNYVDTPGLGGDVLCMTHLFYAKSTKRAATRPSADLDLTVAQCTWRR
jgi:hypothetical protein